jgi:hypothetical protein
VGFHVVKAIVHSNEFIDWCKASKERHDFLSLTAFAMAKAAATKDEIWSNDALDVQDRDRLQAELAASNDRRR